MAGEINWGLLNPNIPAQVADSYNQGQDNALKRAMMQQQQEQGQYALSKARRDDDIQNGLLSALQNAKPEDIPGIYTRYGKGKEAVEMQKGQADIALNKAKAASYKFDLAGQAAGYVSDNPTVENAHRALDYLGANEVFTPEQVAQYKQQTLQNPGQIKQMADMLRQSALSAKDQLAKMQTVNIGGSTIGLSTNPVTQQTTQTFGIQNTQSPDAIARDDIAEQKLQVQQNPLGLSGYGTTPAQRPSTGIPQGAITNPGNLRPQGASTGFQSFATPDEGLAALDKNLQSYGNKGINTVSSIISRWAPPSENDTKSYIADVSRRLSVNPDQPLDMSNPVVRQALSTAITLHEHGPAKVFSSRTSPVAAQGAVPQSGGSITDSGIQVGAAPQGQQQLTVKDAIDQNLHGDDFLSVIQREKPGLASRIKEIANGKQVLPSDNSPATQVLTSLVTQYAPNFGTTLKPPTEFQGKSALYGARAEQADKILNDLGSSYSPTAINAKQGIGKSWLAGGALEAAANNLLSENSQKAEQAQRDFVNAVLRQESGAAIAPSEFANAQKQYFPQPGDSQAVIDQKAANRKLAIQGIQQNAGASAYHAPSIPLTNENAGLIAGRNASKGSRPPLAAIFGNK